MPVAYSPVTNSTPRTPTTSCVIRKPRTGAEASLRSVSKGPDVDALYPMTRPMMTISATAAPRVSQLERSVRNLIHSAWMTRAKVTASSRRQAGGHAAGSGGAAMLFIQ
jgi:pyruvate dehydrogenase complex dehydrogenase (E1) component